MNVLIYTDIIDYDGPVKCFSKNSTKTFYRSTDINAIASWLYAIACN